MKKLLLLKVFAFWVILTVHGQSEINLSGTIVPVRCTQAINSKTAKIGDVCLFETISEVEINGISVIPRGSRVIGKVVSVKAAKSMGKKGRLSLQLDAIVLANGRKLFLDPTTYDFEGKSYVGAAAATIIFYGAGALIKGGNVELNGDTVLHAKIAANVSIAIASDNKNTNSKNNDPTIPTGESNNRVMRDKPGKTALERAIIRWSFDSYPKGGQVFWRIVSSVPDEVKNTNETWLGSTPYEETRSFNILGLTYENSRDVQIEITIRKKGYIDQKKRFNVRQAIDQNEINSFFYLIEEDQ